MKIEPKSLVVGVGFVVLVGAAALVQARSGDVPRRAAPAGAPGVAGPQSGTLAAAPSLPTTLALPTTPVSPVAKVDKEGDDEADDDKDGKEDENEQEIALGEAPRAVQAAFRRAAGDNPIEKVERDTEEGRTFYEAEYRSGNVLYEVEVSAGGDVIKIDRNTVRGSSVGPSRRLGK